MRHLLCAVLFLLVGISTLAQTSTRVSQWQATSLAQKSIAALTGKATLQDVTLNVDAISVLGSDYEMGSGLLRAQGFSLSRVDLNLGNGTRSEFRAITAQGPAGGWKTNGAALRSYANHNCKTDAAWFFPAFTSLSQYGNRAYVFQYLGQKQHGGVNAEHIRIYQTTGIALLEHLSTEDFYLDPTTLLPLAIAFQVHPDTDGSKDIPAEVRFANYHSVNGIQVPFHIQRLLNGGLILDVTVTSATFNSGLPSSTFSLR